MAFDFELWAAHAARSFGIAEGAADAMQSILKRIPHTDIRWRRYKENIPEWWRSSQILQSRTMKMIKEGNYTDRLPDLIAAAQDIMGRIDTIRPPKTVHGTEAEVHNLIEVHYGDGLRSLKKTLKAI